MLYYNTFLPYLSRDIFRIFRDMRESPALITTGSSFQEKEMVSGAKTRHAAGAVFKP
jgi:hypothetical protein